MPAAVKFVLGLMALWGAVYALAALAGDFAVSPPPSSGQVRPTGLESLIIHLHALNALAIFLIEVYIALTLGRIAVGRRVTWVFMMMFFYPIAIPAFWYLYIWRAPAAGDAPRAPSPPPSPSA
jgi:hypothetical protein